MTLDPRAIVRRATHADLDALCALYPLFLDSQFEMEPFAVRNPHFDVRQYVSARLADPAMTVFLGEVDGRPAGFSDCSVRLVHAPPPVETRGVRRLVKSLARRALWSAGSSYVMPFREGYLHNSFVHPDFRGLRLGFELTRVRVEECRRRGAERVRVHTFARNERAQRVFTANGFRPLTLLMEWDPNAGSESS